MLNQSQLSQTLKDVNGWLSDPEAYALYEAASKCNLSIVEIGSYEGRSTIALGLGSQDSHQVTVYAVDPHVYEKNNPNVPAGRDVHHYFMDNIQRKGLSDIIHHYCLTSKEAVGQIRDPVELVFIDSVHDYEHVTSDFCDWKDRLIDGGIIAFHDYGAWGPAAFPGCVKAVDEIKVGLETSHIVDSTIFLTVNK